MFISAAQCLLVGAVLGVIVSTLVVMAVALVRMYRKEEDRRERIERVRK